MADFKLPLAQLSSVVPDHSNMIFIYGRYTLDEMIFKALYEQDQLFYETMEPLIIEEATTPAGQIDLQMSAANDTFVSTGLEQSSLDQSNFD